MILFIDDDKRRMKSYVDELEYSEYVVEFKSDVDSAIEFFKHNQKQVELVILDIMMPAGNIFNNTQTENGLRTGICLYQEIRKQKETIPIIIFTNTSISGDKSLNDIENNEMTLFCAKDSFVPKELVKQIKSLLHTDS